MMANVYMFASLGGGAVVADLSGGVVVDVKLRE